MNQQAKDDESATAKSLKSATPKKRWRVHKRTIAVVFCVVLLPWILIAIPGTVISGGGSSFSSSSHIVHGWPFVHLESARFSITKGTVVNGKFVPGPKPPDSELDLKAEKVAVAYREGRSAVEPNLRLWRDDFSAGWLGESGYWSELHNWPAPRAGTHFTPRYVGLFLNLIIVALLAGAVAALCEYRIRRYQGLLKFSLAHLLIGMAMLGIATAWIVQIHKETIASDRLNENLQMLSDQPNAPLIFFHVDYEARFSLIVSQLLNHGKHPGGAVPVFRKGNSGIIQIFLGSDDNLQKLSRVKELVVEAQYSVQLYVSDFSPQRQRMLGMLDGVNVVTLDLNFDSYNWMYDEFGDEKFDGQWEEARKQAGFKIELDIDMSRLKGVSLNLDWTMSQREQLKPFVGLPALQTASIFDLSTEGAEFILETKERWPKSMEFSFLDEVPDELCRELESKFEYNAELEGGVL